MISDASSDKVAGHEHSGVRSILLAERRVLLFVGDAIAIVVSSLAFASLTSVTRPSKIDDAVGPIFTLLALWLVFSPVFDAYDPRIAARARTSILAAYRAILSTALIFLILPVVGPSLSSRTALIIWLVVWLGICGACRLAIARTLSMPRFKIRALMTSFSREEALEAIALLREAGGSDYQFVACSWLGASKSDNDLPGVPTVSRAELAHQCRALAVQLVMTSPTETYAADFSRQLLRLYESGIRIRHFSDVYEELTGRIPVRHIGDNWILALPAQPGGGRLYDSIRRAADVLIAASALALLLPFLAIAALAIRLDSPGGAIYKQVRVGMLGREFVAYKFRTMLLNAESAGAEWTVLSDPRRTRLGRFLRPARLDELPQLCNVLRGEMTIIGPRPERPDFVATLEKAIPFYRARLLVKPGLSGWAQVRYFYADSVESSLEKLQYDLYYVKHRSLFLDLIVAIKTIGVVLRASGR